MSTRAKKTKMVVALECSLTLSPDDATRLLKIMDSFGKDVSAAEAKLRERLRYATTANPDSAVTLHAHGETARKLLKDAVRYVVS